MVMTMVIINLPVSYEYDYMNNLQSAYVLGYHQQ